MTKTIEDLIRESVGADDLAAYLTAQSGWKLAVYADGSVHVGESVGAEIDPEERPVAVAKCPGLGDIEAELDSLVRKLVEDASE